MEDLRIRQLAGLSTDRAALALAESRKKPAAPVVAKVEESFNLNLLRRMAGLPQIAEDEKPEEEPAEEEKSSEDEEAPAEEETLPAIIKKIAKSIEGKTGEELEATLMKVYNAGKADAEKEEEAAEEGEEVPAEEQTDEVTEGAKPQAAGYSEWFKKIKAKYPDAQERTTGANGWSTLGTDEKGPTLTPHNDGPHYTDVSSKTYSTQKLVGSFNHNTNTGKYFVKDL